MFAPCIELHFRMKGSYYYNAQWLFDAHLLHNHLQLRLHAEPTNPFDNYALQIGLTHRSYQPLFTNLSTGKLPKISIKYHALTWHYRQDFWLLGYVPRILSKHLKNIAWQTQAYSLQLDTLHIDANHQVQKLLVVLRLRLNHWSNWRFLTSLAIHPKSLLTRQSEFSWQIRWRV